MVSILRKYFDIWRDNIMYRKYDRWCEIQEEQHDDESYARKTGMDSVYWCWNCRHSDCDVHNLDLRVDC